MSKSRKSIVTLALSFLIAFCVALVPVKALAAEGKISYLEEIQSVSAGDAQPYALMALNEDYGVATANIHYANAFPSFRKSVVYNPSYAITGDVLSVSLFTYGLSDGIDKTFIALHLPVSVSGIRADDNLTRYEYWALVNGRRYVLGSGDFYNIYLDDKIKDPFIEIGVDLYFSSKYVNDFSSTLLPINGTYDGGVNSQYYDSTGKIIGDQYGDISLGVNGTYIDDIVNNRAIEHTLIFSCSSGSYECRYYEHEEIGVIKQFQQAMQDQIYSLNVNVTNGLNYVRDIIVTKVDEFIGVINTKFTELFTKMEEDQEELINGYQGTGTSDASSRFDQSAGELENVESDLTNITNSSIDNYTDTAFDTSVIASLGSSLVYVVTWFTNFWNMGGLFTSILNVGLALSVAFFILRLRGGS